MRRSRTAGSPGRYQPGGAADPLSVLAAHSPPLLHLIYYPDKTRAQASNEADEA